MTTLSEVAATKVGEIPLRELVQVTPTTPVGDVAKRMKASGRGVVVIIDAGALVGVFTARDLMARCDHRHDEWRKAPVRAVMTSNPVTVRTDETAEVAINLMVTGRYRHLPIVDGQRKVVGVLSIRDVLKHVVGFFPENFINLPSDPAHEAKAPWGG